MKTYLITGCAGFIGSNFVHYMLKKYPEILLVNLDKLTYAGNLENLKDVEGDPRHVFVQGDICDKELVEGLFQKYDFDYVINFAAESHVDRSIKNPRNFAEQRDGHRQPAAARRKHGMMPMPRLGKRARSICRCPPMRCTAHWVRTATLWRPPPVPPQPYSSSRPAPICSLWHSTIPTACP